MRQFTTKAQTGKLMELGFPNPKAVVPGTISAVNSIAVYGSAYSIGELIEFLPKTIEENEVVYSRIIDVDSVAYYSWELEVYFGSDKIFEAEGLIDSLVEACVTLKAEGII